MLDIIKLIYHTFFNIIYFYSLNKFPYFCQLLILIDLTISCRVSLPTMDIIYSRFFSFCIINNFLMKTISNKPSHLQINCIRTMMTTHEDSDDDVFGPILKSKGSRCSTIDSPTIYARKTAFYSTES